MTEDGILVHNGYGELRITDERHKELRALSPSQEIRLAVNEDIALPMKDPALPGLDITSNLHADHIVPLKKTIRMEGFEKLTKEQQLEVLNNRDNFMGLSPSANTSKGSKTYEEWTEHKGKGIPVDPKFREEMMKREKELEVQLQKQIDEFL
ncbi:hypothetical protein [Myroides sp. DF42-4-2]|uniref:hypothetical protein n=1 Tax=Myroides sp. DF42-4-2 TaxID=2746726 RepID=UPI002574B1ED|nr:hypothetical protein [Myroides sp. DF42-4-2]